VAARQEKNIVLQSPPVRRDGALPEMFNRRPRDSKDPEVREPAFAGSFFLDTKTEGFEAYSLKESEQLLREEIRLQKQARKQSVIN